MEHLFREISNEVVSVIASAPPLQEWPECRQFLLDMLSDDEPWIHALPILSCQAAGGIRIDALPVTAAWITLLQAGNLIDDIQDGDLRRLSQFGRPDAAIAIALAWIFAAFWMLEDPAINHKTRLRITNIFAQAGFSSSMGQFQALISSEKPSENNDTLVAYWDTVIKKSGSICMAGASGGAATGTDNTASIEALGDYGTALGVVRQVLDDCRDYWIDTKNHTKQTLPIILQELIAWHSTPPLHVSMKLRGDSAPIRDNSYKAISETGIPEIIADVLIEWRRRALESLQILKPSEARDALGYIFEYVMRPKPNND